MIASRMSDCQLADLQVSPLALLLECCVRPLSCEAESDPRTECRRHSTGGNPKFVRTSEYSEGLVFRTLK